MPWSTPFEDPILLPKGKSLVTLEDAADYIQNLPPAEQRKPLADRDREPDPRRRDRRRLADVRADWRAQGVECWPAGPRCHAKGEEGQNIQDRQMTVFVYVNPSKQIGDPELVKVFATTDAAEKWFEENDPEGVAFEYEVLE